MSPRVSRVGPEQTDQSEIVGLALGDFGVDDEPAACRLGLHPFQYLVDVGVFESPFVGGPPGVGSLWCLALPEVDAIGRPGYFPPLVAGIDGLSQHSFHPVSSSRPSCWSGAHGLTSTRQNTAVTDGLAR